MSKCVDDDFWPMLKFPPINPYSFPRRNMYTVLSKENCNQCTHAVNLLESKDVVYVKKMLDKDFDIEYIKNLIAESGMNLRTFPIVLKDDEVIGGLLQLVQHFK